MRLWSLHPRHLDRRALVAVWREGLLAQAVLRGRTRGYRRHPQLERFRDSGAPVAAIAAYLEAVHAEAVRRGYEFDRQRIARTRRLATPLAVTRGQLRFEWQHLCTKVRRRDAAWWRHLKGASPGAHPLFRTVTGPIASWERTREGATSASTERELVTMVHATAHLHLPVEAAKARPDVNPT